MDNLAVKKKSLFDVRTDLLMTQEELKQASGVGIVAISRCENGNTISVLTAKKLLKTLNEKRQEQGESPLTVDDLDWQLSWN